MTVCIGALCEKRDVVVMASDRMVTAEDLSIEFEHTERKLKKISENCLVATAGDALATTELFNKVESEISNIKSPSISDIINTIKFCYQIVRRSEIEDHILIPRGFDTLSDFYEKQKDLLPEITI